MIPLPAILFLGITITIACLSLPYLEIKQKARLSEGHNCQPANRLSQNWWYFGFDFLLRLARWLDGNIALQSIGDIFEQYGRTVTINVAGQDKIYTQDPDVIKALMSFKASDIGVSWLRQQAWRPLLAVSVQASVGEDWRHGRELLKPPIQSAARELTCLEKHFQNLLRRIPAGGQTVDLQPLFTLLTMDVTTDLFFGESAAFLCRPVEEFQEVEDAMSYAIQTLSKRIAMGHLVYLHGDRKFRRSIEKLQSFVAPFVERALKAKSICGAEKSNSDDTFGSHLFIDRLCADLDDPQRIRDMLLGVLIAGRNTTASLLSFTMWHLARNPDIWAKLQDEVATLNNTIPSARDLQKLTYLRCVLEETLRLQPPVPFTERIANRDIILPSGGGEDGKSPLFIPQGRIFIMSIWHMHRDKELWGDDALCFSPDRFRDQMDNDPRYRPFGGGTRICPGRQLAIAEASYMLCRLVQHFSVLEQRDELPFLEVLGISLSNVNGTKVGLYERHQDLRAEGR